MMELETIVVVTAVVITAIVGPVGLILQWHKLHRYGLRWVILEPKSMMEIAEEIASDLTIHYKGRTIADMTKYEFILHNTGLVPIEKSDIVAPLKWVGPGTVLDARVVVTDPRVDLSLSVQEREVEFSWPIFNQRCKSFVEILCEGGSRNELGRLTGQIRNIPGIDEKRISVLDMDEILERQRLMSQISTPRFLQPLNRIFLNRRNIRISRWFLVFFIYLLTLFYMDIYLDIVYNNGVSPLLAVVVGVVFVIVAVCGYFFFRIRNPYSNLVKKGRERAQKASSGK